ncbi:DUF2750 domain-containing protein [Thalassomonas viridans]|uniref:DUF2750 domain-containing protein n=1 Tax=Thalassomonas viridans TaxID=137584 RepID=A0AAE9Z5C0_9GAMM|nr:DUF2750 domain-containing protein [Thalassomonas viridans]WDE07031.1 DUF2750 domain-containing protein [Thalassomonas viridans]
MNINLKQIEAVIALDGSKRYAHFVKVIADWEEVWGLYQDGWALASTEDGETVFPLWPAKEYAQLCAEKEWVGYQPESFSLDELMEELLPNLKADGVLPGVFYTPLDKGVTPSVEQLLADLNEELDNY